MYAAAMDTGQTAAHLGLAQHSIAPSTLPNSPPVYFSTPQDVDQPILQILQDHDTTQCYRTSADSGTSNHCTDSSKARQSQSSFVRLARPGLLCKFEDMNRKNLDKPD
ncbi:hypothetical protein B0H14DRAFT_2556076 [Mycena olivaceomarginata]|nr:hypothetical protein B0H14DRAFT_2556076 [Mycena olivaceomarginata]